MCAISGMINLPASEKTVRQMLETMHRRGPDDRGVYREKGCTLLHGRLAIIDPEGGRQPMTLTWAGEEYTLVYNGELYNTEQLRGELSVLGHSFLGHSDTEVLLHAYAQFGAECVEKLNGIFAFAVWEKRRERLVLARDRIGVKPLFYKKHDGGLLFASEIKTILTYPTVQAELDENGAAQLILLGPGRLPGSGVFRGISELEPGCCGYFADGELRLCRYWKLMDREHRDSFDETVEKVRFLVTDAIRRQMVSDVPIGTFLSGGLDSSIITAVCAGEMAQRGERLKTFSVDYLNNDKYFQANKFQPNSDSSYIRLMTDALQTDHHWTILGADELAATLEEATIARDLPGMADVDFSLLAFCREIRQKVKVALSGECADEIFGGYLYFHKAPNARAFHEETVRKVGKLHLYDCLRANKSLSAWGVEGRVPFLDKEFLDVAMRINPEAKMAKDGRIEKWILRKAFEELLPEEIVWRQKEQFSDGVGYGWIDTLKRITSEAVSDREMEHAAERFPINPPRNKEEYYYRTIFEEHFPSQTAAQCVPSVPSVACSTAEALAWDAAFRDRNDPSGRAVLGVHNTDLTHG